MRIGVDARVLTQPEMRGIANYLIELLRAWPNSEDEFLLFYEDGQIHSSVNSPAKITRIKVPEPPGTRFKVWLWLAMPRKIKEHSLDLFWSPANLPIPYPGCKQILTVHDTLLQEKFRKHTFFDNLFYRFVVPFWSRRYVSEIITVSDFSRHRIASIFNYETCRITTIHNGFPGISTNNDGKIEAKENLKAQNIINGEYIYALGAISSWKNTRLLLEAFPFVLSQYPHLSLVISGIQSVAMNTFLNLVDNLSISNNVKLLGFVECSIRNTLYQGAELFVYPSLFEGFGFPPLEAMSVGCPVIASDRASIPEVVGKGALLVDCTSKRLVADAIVKVLDDTDLQKKLIRLGGDNILRFKWNNCALKHRELFKMELTQ